MTKKQLRSCADKTRHIILEAACKIFAKKGFSGTSINDISKAAKVNLNLIYHHFGSKEKLWITVKAEAIKNYNTVDCKNYSLKQFLQHIVINRTEFFNKHPDFLRILNWQALEPNQERLYGLCNIFDEWLNHVKRLQQADEIRRNLDPYLVVIFILSACDGAYRSGPEKFETIKPVRQKKYINLIIDGLYRMLSPKDKIED
ncbi:MAG: hypothetical protein A3E87_04130 [Gammaproteobacteria bacterium RIFCSPHIGHO2_12_FULL_35_23]|nr:MAG: hypothetical protein A3E87_04130 [Gammaproteobacteria bacterium RIFCSPHIGHO2_12_FULL_35_23]